MTLCQNVVESQAVGGSVPHIIPYAFTTRWYRFGNFSCIVGSFIILLKQDCNSSISCVSKNIKAVEKRLVLLKPSQRSSNLLWVNTVLQMAITSVNMSLSMPVDLNSFTATKKTQKDHRDHKDHKEHKSVHVSTREECNWLLKESQQRRFVPGKTLNSSLTTK